MYNHTPSPSWEWTVKEGKLIPCVEWHGNAQEVKRETPSDERFVWRSVMVYQEEKRAAVFTTLCFHPGYGLFIFFDVVPRSSHPVCARLVFPVLNLLTPSLLLSKAYITLLFVNAS